MQNKNIYILGAFFIILMGYVVFVELPKQTSDYATQKRDVNLIEDIKSEDITTISIEKKGDSPYSIQFEVNEGEWHITGEGLKADHSITQNIAKFVTELNSDTVISSNPENHAFYEVDDENAYIVTVTTKNNNTHTLYAGKAGSTLLTQYVRMKNSNDVYLVRSSIVFDLYDAPIMYRDKTIFDLDVEEIKDITVANGVDTYTISRVDGGNTISKNEVLYGSESIDTSVVQRYITDITGITAERLQDQTEEDSNATDYLYTIKITKQDDSIIEATVRELDNKLLRIVHSGSDIAYELTNDPLIKIFEESFIPAEDGQ